MKKVGIVAVLLGGLGVLLVVGLCVILGVVFYFFSSSTQRTQAIVAVLNQNNLVLADMQTAVKAAPASEGQNKAMALELPKMVTRLQAIDTSKCPPDFTVAFLRYVQAWDGFSQRYAALPLSDADMLGQALASVLSNDPNNIEEKGQALEAQEDTLKQSWSDVQTVAAKYNVAVK